MNRDEGLQAKILSGRGRGRVVPPPPGTAPDLCSNYTHLEEDSTSVFHARGVLRVSLTPLSFRQCSIVSGKARRQTQAVSLCR